MNTFDRFPSTKTWTQITAIGNCG